MSNAIRNEYKSEPDARLVDVHVLIPEATRDTISEIADAARVGFAAAAGHLIDYALHKLSGDTIGEVATDVAVAEDSHIVRGEN